MNRQNLKQRQLSSDDNILATYLREINQNPLLSRTEEVELATRVKDGDEAAKEQLVKANLRFVVTVAKKYQSQGLPLEDLISEGNIGLMNAVDRFDVGKGVHFISYAVWWIRQAILKAICEKSRMIRLPLNRVNEVVQIEKARKSIHGQEAETNMVQAIAKMLDMNQKHVSNLINISREHISLDTPVHQETDSLTLSDFVEDKATPSPENVVIHNALKQDINNILGTLDTKEANVIGMRFGLNNAHPLSLKEIGDRYGLTKERIRQIEKKALKRLQHPSRTRPLLTYVA